MLFKYYRKLSTEIARNKIYFIGILGIALPSIGDMFVQTLLGFSDMVMVGKIGPSAISGVGVGNVPIMIITTIFFAMGTGTTAIMSRAFGSDNREEGAQVAAQSIFLSIPLVIGITLLTILFSKEILLFIGKENNILEGSKYYLPIALGIPFLGINILFTSLYRAVGYAKVPMYTNIASVLTNIALNYIFIIILKMGVFGAGLATTISRVLVAVIYSYLIFFKKSFWVELPRNLFKYNKGIKDRIVKVAMPAAVEQSIFRLGMLLFEMIAISLGTIPYAAHKITLTAESFSYNIGFGFAVAATSLIGQQMGKGNIKESEKYVKFTLLLSVIAMGLMGGIFLLFPNFIISLFTKDVALKELGRGGMRLISVYQPFMGISMVLIGALRGAGSSKEVMWITTIGMFLIRIPVAFFLIKILGFGFYSTKIAIALELIFRGIFAYYKYKRGKWKSIEV